MRRPRRRAVALILVLVCIAGVFAAALHLAVAQRLATMEATALREHQTARLAAQEAMVRVLAAIAAAAEPDAGAAAAGGDPGAGTLAQPETLDEDDLELPPMIRQILRDSGLELEEAAEEALLDGAAAASAGASAGERTPAAGAALALPTRPIDLRLRGFECRVHVRDAAGGLPVNDLSERELAAWLAERGAVRPRAIAQQIIDWRDPDGLEHPLGAERDRYLARGITLRDAPIEHREELALLPDVSTDLLETLRGDVTTGGDGRVHLGTAPPAVLRGAGLSAARVAALLELRRAGRLDERRVRSIVDLGRPANAARFRLTASPAVRLHVEVRAPGRSEPRLVLEGHAAIAGGAVRALVVEPVEHWRRAEIEP